MIIPVPQGIGPPSLLSLQYDPGIMGLNLLLVTAVSLSVKRRDGTTAVWACAITGASQTKIAFTHAWATTDCPSLGRYDVAPTFTVGGLPVPGNAFYLFVCPSTALRSEFP